MVIVAVEWDGSQWISADVMQELHAIHGEACGSGEDTACGCRLFHLLLDIEVKLLEQNRLTPVARDAATVSADDAPSEEDAARVNSVS